MANYTLYEGDCLEEMKRIADGSIDAIIADLPYGTTACKWDSVIPFEPIWEQFKRVIKECGAVALFGSQPFTSALVMSNIEWFRDELVWVKDRATRHLDANKRPMKRHENIIVFGRNLPKYNPQKTHGHKAANFTRGGTKHLRQLLRGDLVANGKWGHTDRYPTTIIKFNVPNHGEFGLHPTQKPVALLEYLIKTYTNEGETVLDCTMGSGTTGVACMRTGRNFIGIELDPDYFKIAETRIKNAVGEFVLTEKEKASGQMGLFD